MAALSYRKEEIPNEVEDPEKRVAAGRKGGREGGRGREEGEVRRMQISVVCTCSHKLTS